MKVAIEWYKDISILNAGAEQGYITMHTSHLTGMAVALGFFLVLVYSKHRQNNL